MQWHIAKWPLASMTLPFCLTRASMHAVRTALPFYLDVCTDFYDENGHLIRKHIFVCFISSARIRYVHITQAM